MNIEAWLDAHESPQKIGSDVCYVRSDDVRRLFSQFAQEKRLDRGQIIEVLLATMSMSEGVTADAIIAALNATAQDSQL